ncbi:MAG: M12 family metallo-peptidase [Myxococcota bacterium]
MSEDSTFRQRRYSPFVDLPRLSGGAKMVLCLGLNDVIAARDIGDITQTQYTSLRNNIVRAAQKWSDEHLLLRYRFVVEDDYRDCPADPWGRAHSIDIKIQDTHNPDHDIINVDDLGVGTEPEIEYVQNGRTYVDPGSPITLATRLLTMSDPEVVHTVMHEVGHSMGLAHTGTNEGIKVDLTPDQDPNSIMNPFVSNSVDWSCWDRTALTVLFGIHS